MGTRKGEFERVDKGPETEDGIRERRTEGKCNGQEFGMIGNKDFVKSENDKSEQSGIEV